MIEWALAGARLCQYGSALILFGSAVFFLYAFWDRTGSTQGAWPPPWTRSLLAISCAIGVASAFAWLLAEAVMLTGKWSAWRGVVSDTRFGQVLMVRAALLLLTLIATVNVRPVRAVWIIATVLGALSVASFVRTGHGSMGQGNAALWHVGADVVHLCAAALWVGALLPLYLLALPRRRERVRSHSQDLHEALVRFSGIGPIVVGVLTLTGLGNTWFLVGPAHWRALIDSSYGLVLLLKLMLFSCMLALAVRNRSQLTPRLRGALATEAEVHAGISALRISLLAETLLALLVLAAVSLLGTLEPPAP